MIKKCGINDEQKILSYIGNNYSSCLYLYLDLKRYGLNSEIIEAYLVYEQSRVSAILLKYYSCLHVYSIENLFCAKEIVDFFCEKGFSMIYSSAKTAERIYAEFTDDIKRYTLTKGWVAQIKKIDKKPKGVSLEAEAKDFDQIVKMIYGDEDIGKSYNFDELAEQLRERNSEGYARNLVIKKGNLVIAHACTNAEFENIAVVAELLVRDEYRRKGYASEIWREICQELLSEGKEVYSFYYSEESRALHKHIGFFEICEWAKIVIN